MIQMCNTYVFQQNRGSFATSPRRTQLSYLLHLFLSVLSSSVWQVGSTNGWSYNQRQMQLRYQSLVLQNGFHLYISGSNGLDFFKPSAVTIILDGARMNIWDFPVQPKIEYLSRVFRCPTYRPKTRFPSLFNRTPSFLLSLSLPTLIQPQLPPHCFRSLSDLDGLEEDDVGGAPRQLHDVVPSQSRRWWQKWHQRKWWRWRRSNMALSHARPCLWAVAELHGATWAVPPKLKKKSLIAS